MCSRRNTSFARFPSQRHSVKLAQMTIRLGGRLARLARRVGLTIALEDGSTRPGRDRGR